jgi:hypothetical protein
VAHDHVDVGGSFAKALVRIIGEFVRAKHQVLVRDVVAVWKDRASVLAHFDLLAIVLVRVVSVGT